MSLDILCALQSLVVRHGLHALLPKCLEGGRVFPEIELRTDEDDGDIRRMVVDFGVPLSPERLIRLPGAAQTVILRGKGTGSEVSAAELDDSTYLGLHVVEGWRADDGEADEEHVRLRIRQRP